MSKKITLTRLPKYLPLYESRNRYNVLFGSAGSGKSFAITQFLLSKMVTIKGLQILVTRKIDKSLRNSVYKATVKVIEQMGAGKYFTCTTSPMSIKCKASGSEMVFIGVDDPEKLKSLSEVHICWMEEATEFEIEDFEQLDTRMRGRWEVDGVVQKRQLIMSFNPVSELHWIKREFYDGDAYSDDLMTIHATYKDNPFLEEDDIQALRRKAGSNPNHVRVYLNGDWGVLTTDGMFYKKFNSMEHVKPETKYRDDLPIWISFDFNHQPYCACTIWQLQKKEFCCVDEIALESPHNTIKDTAAAAFQKYKHHKDAVFVTGDPAGKHGDSRQEKGENDFTILMRELYPLRPRLRMHSSAPSVAKRGEYINELLSGNRLYTLAFAPHTKHIQGDYTYGKETSEGGKDKTKVLDKKTGIRVEKYHHMSDSGDYAITMALQEDYREFLHGPVMDDMIQLGPRTYNPKWNY